jgi:WD40 repeat protein
VIGAAFSTDGRRLVVLVQEDGVRVVDRASGKSVGGMPSGGSAVQSVRFTADGRRMLAVPVAGKVRLLDAVTLDGKVRLLDAMRGRSPAPSPAAAVTEAAAITRDGGQLAVGTRAGALEVQDVSSGRVRAATQHLRSITSVAFDPAGARIVTISDDRTARVWDAHALDASVAVLRGHDDRLLSAEFSPDGRFVLTSSMDGTARLWDPGLETTVLVFTKSKRGTARFSPDGRLIAIGGSRTVELHRCEVCAPFDKLVRLARARLPAG